ncbi:MAG: TRAP transporter small permease [Rhodoferax sp.]|uniref:TRAP transporter small permease n=1 Tax=Rhodoferax sp. TaxID=50421 RepID=UPI00273103F2|nr:TRAP transporter small permease [Rhodoferax sp.]MDP1531176.1 TRAP transporter small permease [Rhodoferax sp.]MDP1942226.1 TRAP transporter small permease [Rhodoferax sp.]
MKPVKSLLRVVGQAELAIGAMLAIYIILIMVIEIVMRYIFNNSIIWVQETVMLAFIWITCLGASVAMMTESHISITTLTHALTPGVQKVLKVIVSLAVLGCLLFLAYTLPAAIANQNRTLTSSLPINFPRGMYYSLPIMVSVLIMIVTRLYYLVFEVRTCLGLTNPKDYGIDLVSSSKQEDVL